MLEPGEKVVDEAGVNIEVELAGPVYWQRVTARVNGVLLVRIGVCLVRLEMINEGLGSLGLLKYLCHRLVAFVEFCNVFEKCLGRRFRFEQVTPHYAQGDVFQRRRLLEIRKPLDPFHDVEDVIDAASEHVPLCIQHRV